MGYFNMHLLDEEILDSQPYLGEDHDPDAQIDTRDASQKEADLQKEMKKYMNVDFDFNFEDDQDADGDSEGSNIHIP